MTKGCQGWVQGTSPTASQLLELTSSPWLQIGLWLWGPHAQNHQLSQHDSPVQAALFPTIGRVMETSRYCGPTQPMLEGTIRVRG